MKSFKVGIYSSLLVLAALNPVRADFVGLNIGANHWMPDVTGSFKSNTSTTDTTINLKNDLGYKDDSSTSLSLSFEHPVPFIPNIKYSGYDLNSSSVGSASFNFKGKPYTGIINSTLDLSHNDIVLYYELLDNWVNVDLGLDFKKFDGKVSVSDTTNSETIDVDETIPMLYLAARFDLPLTGMYIGANIQQLSVGDNSSEDTTLMVGYESKSGLGVEGGIKTFSLDLQDSNNLNTNLEYDGIYLNGYFHF
jgi:outer membrane protein